MTAAAKYRIVEWTSVFRDGSRKVAYEPQSQNASNPKQWTTLGTSPTLAYARKALLFYTPNGGSGISWSNMDQPLSKEESLAIVRRTYQEVIDTLLYISDEMEMQWLPPRDGASALRLAASLFALTKELT